MPVESNVNAQTSLNQRLAKRIYSRADPKNVPKSSNGNATSHETSIRFRVVRTYL
jgi:hypothetical protein